MSGVVIVGGGQGAFQLSSSLRAAGYDDRITILGAEAHLPYYRPPLSKTCLKHGVEIGELAFKPAAYYAQQGIAVHLGATVISIERGVNRVCLASGATFQYNHLVLATGMRPRRLFLDTAQSATKSFVLRSAADAEGLHAALTAIQTLGIIGGGYIGLEIASAARERDISVLIFEREERLLARVASPETSLEIANLHERHGVEIRYGADIHRFDGASASSALVCNTHGTHRVNAVLTGIGGDPECDLASQAGLDVNRGIVTDEFGVTSDPAISAIGDCAAFYHPSYGRHVRLESVPNVIEQAKAVAARLCGVPVPYSHVPWFWSDQYGSKLQSVGLGAEAEMSVVRREPGGGVAIFGLSAGRIVSVDALDSPRNYVLGRKLVERAIQAEVTELADPRTEIARLLERATTSTNQQ